MKLIKLLDKDTFFVLDMSGKELMEKSGELILNTLRMAKLERVLEDLDL